MYIVNRLLFYRYLNARFISYYYDEITVGKFLDSVNYTKNKVKPCSNLGANGKAIITWARIYPPETYCSNISNMKMIAFFNKNQTEIKTGLMLEPII